MNNILLHKLVESQERSISFLTHGWSNKLYRIQLSFDKKLKYLDRQACYIALQNFITSLENEFYGLIKKGIETERRKKFELDKFHIRWQKTQDQTGTGIIEIFKQEIGVPRDFEEMRRKELRKYILTADEIKVTLELSDKVDVLNKNQIGFFLTYIYSLKSLASQESIDLLESIEKKLATASELKIRRDSLLGLLVLTQHQFGGK